jgi:hypothetical protein
MNGIITLKTGQKLVFRNDTGHGSDIWAWDIQDDIGKHCSVTKWQRFPQGSIVELFDVDNPPTTVAYLPLIGE